MAGARYRAEPADAMLRIELDGLTALFHRPSGSTHVVAPPAPQILDALLLGPADAEEILARMAAVFEIEGEGSAAVEARLAELEAAGLVSRE